MHTILSSATIGSTGRLQITSLSRPPGHAIYETLKLLYVPVICIYPLLIMSSTVLTSASITWPHKVPSHVVLRLTTSTGLSLTVFMPPKLSQLHCQSTELMNFIHWSEILVHCTNHCNIHKLLNHTLKETFFPSI